MKMFGDVPVLRVVAAADVTARFAEAQVYPRVQALQTFFASDDARRHVSNLVEVRALVAIILLLSSSGG